MSAHVRTAAAALVVVGVLAGCSHTTTGTVAMTTEPGPTTRTTTSKPTTTKSPRTSTPGTPSAPAPGNALTMTCKEYTELDPADQSAVIDAILAEEGSVLGPESADIAKTLADAVCQFLPDGVVSEILLGGGPP